MPCKGKFLLKGEREVFGESVWQSTKGSTLVGYGKSLWESTNYKPIVGRSKNYKPIVGHEAEQPKSF